MTKSLDFGAHISTKLLALGRQTANAREATQINFGEITTSKGENDNSCGVKVVTFIFVIIT